MAKVLLVITALLCAGQLSAKKLPRMDFPMNGNVFIVNGGSAGVTHFAQLPPQTNWSTYHNTPQSFYSFINTIELSRIESTLLPVNFDYSLKVEGELTYWTLGSSTPVSTTIALSLHSDPAAKSVRRLDYYSYSNAYKSQFTIQNVLLTTQGTMTSNDLYAEVSKVVELNFGIQGTAFSAPVFTTSPALHGPCVDPESNELVISWTPVSFAEEYELEITFRDNYTDDIAVARPVSSIPYDFKENSTRIVTRNNYYRVPLTYERGYLLYRVRAVGMGGNEWDKRIPCQWSGPTAGMVGSFPDRYGPISSHVGDKMNWQLSTTYSDDGKRKDVVQYYDGLFMNRQTVTGMSRKRNVFTENVGINTVSNTLTDGGIRVPRVMEPVLTPLEEGEPSTDPDGPDTRTRLPTELPTGGKLVAGPLSHTMMEADEDLNVFNVAPRPTTFGCGNYGGDKIKEIVAQEVIYDFNGRPALQILPVPTGTHRITYIRKLNRNQSGNPYSWKDFDLIDNCRLTAHPLTDNVTGALGAGVYYSPNNPNRIGYNAFVPDSKGFPFTRVQYTEDNTRRAYRQGGVGNIFQLEEGHETKFYYGKPNQVELDRMFGIEVGYAVRYQKNMVVDPNGQVSVTYLNPEGKTIATALAGVKPDNLMELDNQNYPAGVIPVDLAASNVPDSLEHSLTINEQFTVTDEGTYSFTYTVNGETLSYSSCADNHICLDCIYDLEIRLIHNESCTDEPLVSYTGTFGDIVQQTGRPRINLDCFDPTGSDPQYVAKPTGFPSTFTKTLKPGSYTLVKRLKANDYAAEAYVNEVFRDTCTSLLDSFLAEELDKVDTAGCYRSCASCMDAHPNAPDECDLLCPEPMNECERARQAMLGDVSPGGQYARYDVTATGYDASSYPLSIFNISNQLPGQPNCLSVTGEVDLKLLIDNWDESTYPEAFLPFHPEYCMLEWCENQNIGSDYDLKLRQAESYDEAIDANLLNISDPDPAYAQLLANDPFFNSGPGVPDMVAFRAFLDHPCGNVEGKSLLEMVMDAAYCQSQPGYQNLLSNLQSGIDMDIDADFTQPSSLPCTIPAGYYANHPLGSDPALKDLQWNLLRDLYLSYKEKYLYESRREYSIVNGCFNGCIGSEDYLYWPFDFQNYDGSSINIPEGRLPVNDDDPCGKSSRHGYYEKKVKRFTNRYDAFSHMAVDLNGIDLYGCLTPTQITTIQTQIGSIVDQYVCGACVAPLTEDSCWVDDLVAMLDTHLPLVTAERSVTLAGDDLPISVRTMNSSLSGSDVARAALEYNSRYGRYTLLLTHTNEAHCYISFPATLAEGAPKPIGGVCCGEIIDEQQIEFTLLFSDGTQERVTALARCPLPVCPDSVVVHECDTCSGINSAAADFFLSLKQIKRLLLSQKESDEQGERVPQGELTPMEVPVPIYRPSARAKSEIQGEIARQTVTLTIDVYNNPSGDCELTLDGGGIYLNGRLVESDLTVSPNNSSDAPTRNADVSSPSNREIPLSVDNRFSIDPGQDVRIGNAGPDVVPTVDPATVKPALPPPCTVTFDNCDWLDSTAHLVSITPYFPSGQGNVPTNEFILTYLKFNGDQIDTLTVHGTSGCFTVNDCHPPHFCDRDTLWQTMAELPPSDFNGCVQSKLLTATYLAHERYARWVDSMKVDLLEKYYAKCMGVGESMEYEYTDRQFHFTLYYYDQAGNLVRTVPPAGVRLLPPSDAPMIAAARNAHTPPNSSLLPKHRYITNYAYNSLNQTRGQVTPDAGRTVFFYDKLGRIAASQNAEQQLQNLYSYTWYDELGRVVESGRIELKNKLKQGTVLNYTGWKNFLYSKNRTEITYTQYDKEFTSAISDMFGADGQQNLRGRVASVLSFMNRTEQAAGEYRHATHYTYDVTGNVPILLQDYPGTPLGVKAIAYNFDLLTGKVNEVRYSPDQPDEFRHRYGYDDELRLTTVSTSKKGIVWETDAEYFYYKHGPLARTELGELKVQGLDYLYTLQGWIKGVNGTTGERTEDAGQDGIALEQPGAPQTVIINGQPVTIYTESDPNLNSGGPGYHSLHNPVAADAFGYVLSYYDGDYTPIVPGLNPVAKMDGGAGDIEPLYNGNISRMYTYLQELGGLGMNYRYDRLNRLKKQQGFEISPNGHTLLPNNAYGMELTYDGSGNIITMLRNGTAANPNMDNLTYHYLDRNGNVIPDMANPPANATNRLGYVSDDPAYTNNYPEASPANGTVTDIDNQSIGNFAYDEIGNLVQDKSEGIDKITWNLQNKVRLIDKSDGSRIRFEYDALGNRVYKQFTPGTQTPKPNPFPGQTYYVRDAQGNIMATYEVRNGELYLGEMNLYGSSRLGVWNADMLIPASGTGLSDKVDWQDIGALALTDDSTIRGSKQYELSNHLGNVLATVSDKRVQVAPLTGTSGVLADLLSAGDYYAFGMGMAGRMLNLENYRFGFGGHENIDEVYNVSDGVVDMGDRWLDTRLGRTPKPDAKQALYPGVSPYSYALNSPSVLVDPDGRTVKYANEESEAAVQAAMKADPEFAKSIIKLDNSDVIYNYTLTGTADYNKAALLGSVNPGGVTSDGSQINIGFQLIVNSVTDGPYTSLYHETEHGLQFEHGEIGFRKNDEGKWVLDATYDINDEVKAFEAGFNAPGADRITKKNFEKKAPEQKINYVARKHKVYRSLKQQAQSDKAEGDPVDRNHGRSPDKKQKTVKTDTRFLKSNIEREKMRLH